MLGAIIGDIVGSTREWHNIKTEDFEMVPTGSRFTDDTVMTLAVAEWLMTDSKHKPETLVACMQRLGRKYINAGYGSMFRKWLLSEHPQPYNSFGNGSAMRVSPIGLYANSLEEALELARISASVSHNHPEGIKGAQAIAGCVYLKSHAAWSTEHYKINQFVTETIGYNLDSQLEDIRNEYTFDITCQGSVPIAIMAYLQRYNYPPEKSLRLAISMGGDSDTIGCMTAAIAAAEKLNVIGSDFDDEVIKKCRALLPTDLLDINDRFEGFISKPLKQSYYLHGYLYAGEYPGDRNDEVAKRKIEHMVHFGIKHFVDLTVEGELKPYRHLLPKGVTYMRFPIPDCGVPKSIESVNQLIDKIEDLSKMGGYTYIHCWGGVGRTGTIVGCLKARELKDYKDLDVLQVLRNFFSGMPKSAYRKTPDTKEQEKFIIDFAEKVGVYNDFQKNIIRDSIKGCLMAGAVGDALGYPVEFMSYRGILSKYGNSGITQFNLSKEGKALVSDDTQMTLFTACGMLMGVTRGYMRGIGGAPEDYVDGAYIDWYYTQTGMKKDIFDDYHYTWLRDLPELAHRRAPGNTCLSACEMLLRNEKVSNMSKGCGGIMRVAPMALLMAGYKGRGTSFYDIPVMDEAGAKVAEVTHKHPLGFLPAAMLTHLIYKVVCMDAVQVKRYIKELVSETIESLDTIFVGKYGQEKNFLANLTHKAIELAENNKSDIENIKQLGEGWTGDEAWAIALYCTVRHIDSVEDAITAAVNHSGDSDSTGAICGNIIGAIYGYESINEQNICCPKGKKLEDTLELTNVILTLADDLYTSCVISEYEPIDTPEKKRWYARYCQMMANGL